MFFLRKEGICLVIGSNAQNRFYVSVFINRVSELYKLQIISHHFLPHTENLSEVYRFTVLVFCSSEKRFFEDYLRILIFLKGFDLESLCASFPPK